MQLTLSDSRWSEEWFATNSSDRALANRMSAREAASAPAARAAHMAQLDARRSHDVWDRLAAIDCPTLVAYGRYDGIAPPANSAAIASRIAGADLRGYAGGHWFLAQDPAALPELVAFLASGD